MSPQRIVVTGANKGIGRAVVRRILVEHPEAFVFLGSRDEGRGAAARAAILEKNEDWAERLEVLPIDVSSDESVRAAAARVAERFPGEAQPLYGVVNNAGLGRQGNRFGEVLSVNAWGPHRVCEAFVPLITGGGRVVIVSSASGPSFLAECSERMRRFFTDPAIEWEALDALLHQTLAFDGPAAFEASGLSDGDAYGLSKAAANAVMLIVAREHPRLMVSACTPGFIATDMTRPYAEASEKTPAEMGMKTPHEGAHAPLHLLFGELQASGWYYGSDAERSPLDRYRSPGDPPFAG
jgi:NAD(P)-dependent dehydrogenase (short-subunit alcohol dehydrogenase family)